nr:unnamed protein product [Bacillus thuringiensis]
MNPYQNKNEYETLNASQKKLNISNNYTRYPIENSPKQLLQSTNYKDWLNMCQQNQQYGGDFETFIDSGELSAYTIVVGTVLTGFGFTTPLGLALIGFGTLIPVLFPAQDQSNTWSDFITQTKNIIKKEIASTYISNANKILNRSFNVISTYHNHLKTWENNPNPQNTQDVRTQIQLVHYHFQNVIPELVNSCPPNPSDCDYYNILVLSSYAQAANLHLTVLNQAVKFEAYLKNNRQFDYLEPLPTAIDYYPVLTKAIEDYTNYCVTTYKKGLNLIKTTPDSNLDGNINWNTYNTYRTKMTTAVLDVVALFPNYDVGKYPIGVQSELTREIYQVLNFEESPYKYYDFQYQEDSLTRRPHLFTWLDSLNFYEKAQTTPNNFFTSHYNMFHYTLDNISQKSSVFGNHNVTDKLKSLGLATNIYIFLLNVISLDNKYLNDYNNISKMDFFITNGTRLLEKELTAGSGQITYDVNKNIFGLPILKRRENQGNPTLFPTYDNYSHILSFIKSLSIPATYKTQVYTFAWTHSSVDPKNTIYTHLTTQIPAVKANSLGTASKVVQGPGHTGGDLIDFKDHFKITCQHSNFQQSYFIRIRYASNGSANTRAVINLSIPGVAELGMALNPTFSGTDYTNLKYKDFQYLEFSNEVKFAPNQNISLVFNRSDVYTNTTVLIDKIEFLPITRSIREDREKQKLETVQQIINTFYANPIKNTLQSELTDYDIDQAANLVECISEELYPKEKMLLLDEVKNAKQLSQSRNVLQNGDFESATLGWTTSDNITIQEDDPIFKGHYLHMSGARDIDGTIFPTYIFQKIDESKLKPYTRYLVRGFVGSSKDVELVVSRYGEEIDAIMNVPADLNYLYPSTFDCEGSNRCETSAVPANIGNTSDMLYSCQYDTGKKHVVCQDSHQFSFTIDTGALDTNENIGVWVMFKISSPDGYASLDNLEVIEEGPIDGEALSRVKHMEKKWNDQMEAKRSETQQAYDVAKQAIDALFTNVQDEALQFDTTLAQIQYAEYLVQSIPYVYNDWLSDVPGMNYDIYVELDARVAQARYLYDIRNIIKNGDFTQGVMGWHVTGNADVQQIDGVSVLVLSNWSAGVSQNVHLQHNHGYVLGVIAKKEGPGNGYVTLMDWEENQEKLTFTSCEEGYITKTVDVFPDTDRVRIEIGETEGSFYIESIELICMNE